MENVCSLWERFDVQSAPTLVPGLNRLNGGHSALGTDATLTEVPKMDHIAPEVNVTPEVGSLAPGRLGTGWRYADRGEFGLDVLSHVRSSSAPHPPCACRFSVPDDLASLSLDERHQQLKSTGDPKDRRGHLRCHHRHMDCLRILAHEYPGVHQHRRDGRGRSHLDLGYAACTQRRDRRRDGVA